MADDKVSMNPLDNAEERAKEEADKKIAEQKQKLEEQKQ